jgi:serine/threonine protein kinase
MHAGRTTSAFSIWARWREGEENRPKRRHAHVVGPSSVILADGPSMHCAQCRHLNAPDHAVCVRCGAALGSRTGGAWGPSPRTGVLAPGEVVSGRYRIEALLGQGAMGTVYRVLELTTGRPSALKVLHATLLDNWKARERMSREIRALARVRHPNVVELYDLVAMGDALAIELELVTGGTLASRIARGPLPVEEARRILGRVLSGLQAIHGAGLIHRDLKPGNILMTAEGMPKIADLGIARDPTVPGLTAPGTALGTAEYMSPEQVRGVEVGPESDLYACGIMLYELLTGSVPFDSRVERDVLAAQLGRLPDLDRLPAYVSDTLRRVIALALEKAPERRWRTAQAMGEALEDEAPRRVPVEALGAMGSVGSGQNRAPARIGEYTVHRLVGEGGMGRVYEAEERLSGRKVALKVLRSEIGRSEATRQLFLGEMAILAQLDHPNVVRSLASLEVQGDLVMVLEYLQGQTLREVLQLRGRLAWPEAAAITRQITSALERAHSTSPPIVHRDLKPENVMLLEGGVVKVMDFGIAKVLDSVNRTATLSVGTLAYMSPEQIDARALDARSDLYSVGLLLYEMLVGTPPFRAQSQRELLNLQCAAAPPPFPQELRRELPSALEWLTFQLLAKSPAERPPTARAVLEVLEPLVGASPEARPAAAQVARIPAGRGGSTPLEIPWVVAVIILFLLSGLAGAVAFLVRLVI